MLRVGQMHRAAKAAAKSVFAAVNFRHHLSRRRAEHDRVTMATVAWHRQIVLFARRECAHDRGFRAVSQMRVTADYAGMLDKRPLDATFKLSDAHHLRINPN